PFTTWVQRLGAPRWAATLASSFIIVALVGAVGLLIANAAFDLAQRLPTQAVQISAQVDHSLTWLERHGLGALGTRLRETDLAGEAGALAQQLVGSIFGFLQALVVVVITTAFIQLDTPALR